MAHVPVHHDLEPRQLERRLHDREPEVGPQAARDALGERDDVVGLGDDQGRHQEVRDRHCHASLLAARLERVVDRTAARRAGWRHQDVAELAVSVERELAACEWMTPDPKR
jgi:hypothetical protein